MLPHSIFTTFTSPKLDVLFTPILSTLWIFTQKIISASVIRVPIFPQSSYLTPFLIYFPLSCMVFKLVRLFCARIGTPLRLVYGASHEEESIDSNMVVFPFHQTFTSKPLLSASAQQHRAEFWQEFVRCQFYNLIFATFLKYHV